MKLPFNFQEIEDLLDYMDENPQMVNIFYDEVLGCLKNKNNTIKIDNIIIIKALIEKIIHQAGIDDEASKELMGAILSNYGGQEVFSLHSDSDKVFLAILETYEIIHPENFHDEIITWIKSFIDIRISSISSMRISPADKCNALENLGCLALFNVNKSYKAEISKYFISCARNLSTDCEDQKSSKIFLPAEAWLRILWHQKEMFDNVEILFEPDYMAFMDDFVTSIKYADGIFTDALGFNDELDFNHGEDYCNNLYEAIILLWEKSHQSQREEFIRLVEYDFSRGIFNNSRELIINIFYNLNYPEMSFLLNNDIIKHISAALISGLHSLYNSDAPVSSDSSIEMLFENSNLLQSCSKKIEKQKKINSICEGMRIHALKAGFVAKYMEINRIYEKDESILTGDQRRFLSFYLKFNNLLDLIFLDVNVKTSEKESVDVYDLFG